MLTDLSQSKDVMGIVCSFLFPSRTRCNSLILSSDEACRIASTCRPLWKCLGELAKDELLKLQQEADTGFQDRISTILLAAETNDVVTDRMQVVAAYRTHMHALGPARPQSRVQCFAVHPDGTMLLIGCAGGRRRDTLSLWDIPSGRHIQSFGADKGVDHCSFTADGKRIVSCSNWDQNFNWGQSIRIWDLDGTCAHSISMGKHTIGLITEDCVYSAPWPSQPMSMVDLNSGHVTTADFLLPPQCKSVRLFQLGKDRLLAALVGYQHSQLCVYDAISLEPVSHLLGTDVIHYRFVDANDQGNVVAWGSWSQEGCLRVDVFGLQGDNLAFSHSFDITAPAGRKLGPLWKLCGSHLFVSFASMYEPFGSIHVYNIDSGCLVRQLMYPSPAKPIDVVVTNRLALVGFSCGPYPVKAYAI